jgi:hypothetical protein
VDNIALRSLQFSVILDYKREIDSPKGYWAVFCDALSSCDEIFVYIKI